MRSLHLALQILRERGSSWKKRQSGRAGRGKLLLRSRWTADNRMNRSRIVELMMSTTTTVLNAEQYRRWRHATVVVGGSDGATSVVVGGSDGATGWSNADIRWGMLQHGPVRRRWRAERRAAWREKPVQFRNSK